MNVLAGVTLAHFFAAAMAAGLGRHVGRWVFAITAAGPAATLVWAALKTSLILDGGVPSASVSWVPGLDLQLSARVDAFSLLMLWLIGATGVLVCVYCAGYFATPNPRLGVFAGVLSAFAGSMVGLVIADDVFLLFVFWELTSITSFLLIGFNHHEPTARASALQALLVTVAGGLALIGGLVILAGEAETSSLHGILAAPPDGALVSVALVFIVVGAAAKSAQFPLHFWLPGAMAAPTPVSAFLHSATMVKAGVYLIARFAPSYAEVAIWRPMVITIGVVTMLAGALTALKRTDLKQILAYGTISQLGLLFILFGYGDPALTTAGVGVLVAHALYKAAMFMMVGIVDHQAGTRNINALSGVGRSLPGLAVVAAVAGASMAGIPPLLGFAAKEQAISALFSVGGRWQVLLVAAVVTGSALTVAYSGRVLWGAFSTKADLESLSPVAPAKIFVAPVAVLAGISVTLGLAPSLVTPLLDDASAALIAEGGKKHLVLWPGFNTALVVSLVILIIGGLCVAARDRVDAASARVRLGPSGESIFAASVSAVLRGAERVTATVQSGSLPVYLVVVFLTAVALPGSVLVSGGARWPTGIPLADSPIQAMAGALIILAAAAAALLRQRIAAVLALGAVGLGVGVLFIIEGGPDLALTQLLVETVLIVAFAFVFRHLPGEYRRRAVQRKYARGRMATRIAVAGLTGAMITTLALTTASVSRGSTTRDIYLERAPAEAGGRNVVNTILVDFRALDTLGEITVLVIASIGVLALVGAARQTTTSSASTPDRAGRPRRSDPRPAPLLETGVALIFHTIIVVALYLLFAGHNQPGGGFIAGLVAGAALAIRHLAVDAARPRREPTPEAVLGLGLLIAVGTGIGSIVVGYDLLESGKIEVDLPLLGTIKAFSVLVFDIGVFLVVVGLVMAVLDGLGLGTRRSVEVQQ